MADPAAPDELLHDEIVERLASLGLGVPVLKRRLPAVAERIDEAPALFVTPAGVAGEDEPFSTEEMRKRTYVFQVVLATRSGGDNSAGDPSAAGSLGGHRAVRQKVRGVFGPSRPLDSHPGFLKLRVTPGPLIDREAFSKSYDYDSVCAVWVECVEDA